VSKREGPFGYIQTDFISYFETEPVEEAVHLRRLHESLAPYIDVPQLRRLVAEQQDINEALRTTDPPPEVHALMSTLAALLRPRSREQIKSPADVVGLLMVEMGYLDQEELRTVLLDTKNRVQDIVTIYRGSLNTSLVRVGEVYKAALKRNSAAIIVAHNHPSGDVTPSPEDVLVTREIVSAGILLDVECLDHLVIGQGKWTSMRERGLGFVR
jgi:DNA repair protein RadC